MTHELFIQATVACLMALVGAALCLSGAMRPREDDGKWLQVIAGVCMLVAAALVTVVPA